MKAALALAAVLLLAVFAAMLVVDHCLKSDSDDSEGNHA